MEAKFTEGPYTPCLQIFCGEVTGFHITASPHGSTRPLAKFHDGLDTKYGTFAPGELKANAHLFATSYAMYRTLETLLAVHGDDLLPTFKRTVELVMASARGETLEAA